MGFWILYVSWFEVLLIPIIISVLVVISIWYGMEGLRIVRAEEAVYLRTITETERNTIRNRNRLLSTNLSVRLLLLDSEVEKHSRRMASYDVLCTTALDQIGELLEKLEDIIKNLKERIETANNEEKAVLEKKENKLNLISKKLDKLFDKCFELKERFQSQTTKK